jgi:BirA family biotin operon repressor/biotin-[acetyl-CoA-carboxylase] ligase
MFDEAGVRRGLASTRFPHLRYAAETDSTNDDASAELGNAAAAGTLFVADYQRHGRGRRGRRWVAPRGNALLCTAILPEPLATSVLWKVPFWCALAVADGVRALTNVALELQWPNDLLLGGRKVCGILSTSRIVGELAWAACGMGINVTRPNSRAAGVERGAAFLSDSASSLAREDVLVAVVRALDARLPMLYGSGAVAQAWESAANLAGTPYRILVDGEEAPFVGRALRLGAEGALVVEVDGREREVALGDARVLRDRS